MINLLKSYEDIIKNDSTSQKTIDEHNSDLYFDYFVRPDLRINRRASYNSKGELIDALHIYPDRECICEMLKKIQDYLNNNIDTINKFQNNKFGMLLYISEIVNGCINSYFGTNDNVSETDKVFHDGINNISERMANLADFKGKNSAVCQERALATYILLYTICHNSELQKVYPFKPFFCNIGCCLDLGNKGYDGTHAMCGIVSRDNKKKMYLLDPTNYGLVEDKNGNQQYIYGLYELTDGEIEAMFNKEAIEPTLFRCRHVNGLSQLSHRAFSEDPRKFDDLRSQYSGGQKL